MKMLQKIRCSISSNIRRQLIATAICTGVAYRVYSTWYPIHVNPVRRNTLPLSLPVLACSHPRRFPLLANNFEVENDPPNNNPDDLEKNFRRAAKLDFILTWITEQIPVIFTRGLFNTVDVFDSNTTLEFERICAPSLFLKGPTQANLAFALLRTYYFLISHSRRMEVLSVNVDDKNWVVETHLRLVLLPSPAREDRSLCKYKLVRILESKAKWIEFRVIFHLNKKGEIPHVKITRVNKRKPNYEWSLSKTQMRRLFPAAQGLAIPLASVYSSKPDNVDLKLDLLFSRLQTLFKNGSPVDTDLYSSEKKCEDYVYSILCEADNKYNRQISPKTEIPVWNYRFTMPLLMTCPKFLDFFSFSASLA